MLSYGVAGTCSKRAEFCTVLDGGTTPFVGTLIMRLTTRNLL